MKCTSVLPLCEITQRGREWDENVNRFKKEKTNVIDNIELYALKKIDNDNITRFCG